MEPQIFVVTGGNAGIGKAIATGLAQRGGHVVIVSRDPQKGAQAQAEIRTISGNKGRVDLVVGDLGTIAGTKALATRLLEGYPRLDVLINNAGVWMPQRVLNADGLETTFMVNHLAPFLLTNLLLPRLQASAPARIVNVNAGLYIRGKLDLTQTPYGHDFSAMGTYANTKLCNMLFTAELARRLGGSRVTVNAVHPGVIRTGLGARPGLIGALLGLVKRFWGTPEAGAEAPIWLATDPALAGISGRYYILQEESPMNALAQDPVLAHDLWDLSARLAGLPTPSPVTQPA